MTKRTCKCGGFLEQTTDANWQPVLTCRNCYDVQPVVARKRRFSAKREAAERLLRELLAQ